METRTWVWFASLTDEQRENVRKLDSEIDPQTLMLTFHEPVPASLPPDIENTVVEPDPKVEEFNRLKQETYDQ